MIERQYETVEEYKKYMFQLYDSDLVLIDKYGDKFQYIKYYFGDNFTKDDFNVPIGNIIVEDIKDADIILTEIIDNESCKNIIDNSSGKVILYCTKEQSFKMDLGIKGEKSDLINLTRLLMDYYEDGSCALYDSIDIGRLTEFDGCIEKVVQRTMTAEENGIVDKELLRKLNDSFFEEINEFIKLFTVKDNKYLLFVYSLPLAVWDLFNEEKYKFDFDSEIIASTKGNRKTYSLNCFIVDLKRTNY